MLKRFGYYSVGLILGSIVVFFFWKNKNVSFDYGMDARTLKSIRIKKRFFSENATNSMKLYNIDTSKISKILRKGNVDFSKSKPRKRPCAEYSIANENIEIYVIRCDSTATVDKIRIIKN